jgi:predicted nucleic acid-binding protein
MAHTTEFRKKTPEKWRRVWDQLYSGKNIMILLEPLISEIYYQIEGLSGKSAARHYLFRLKGMQNTVIPLSDMDKVAFLAGEIKMRYKQDKISLVDSYLIAAAIKERATIYTTDHAVRDSARQEKCEVQYLPKQSLS